MEIKFPFVKNYDILQLDTWWRFLFVLLTSVLLCHHCISLLRQNIKNYFSKFNKVLVGPAIL